VLLGELERFEPAIAEATKGALQNATMDLGFLRLDPEAYGRATKKSINCAIMERTSVAAVIDCQFRWSDIGSWDALFDVAARDVAGNVLQGPAVVDSAQNCLVHADGRLTVVLGANGLIVITTPDAVLVVPCERAEEIKTLVARLKNDGRPEASEHRRIYRPWGYYDSIDNGNRFQVKRIVVSPGGKLSLQKHMHRAEHWVVVRGTAETTIGDTVQMVHENQSVYIPIGAIHRLANPGRIPLELIEVQTGSYLGEDDIVRLDDVYQRN
jgi:mannose-1-phosphate guanylyltransferase/mannose-6-phosphate isomerase